MHLRLKPSLTPNAASSWCWCLLLLSLLQDIESQVEMMDQARHAVAGGPLSGFAYSGNFLWWDRDKNMDQQILQNLYPRQTKTVN